jgi:nucleolar protein 58
VLLSRRLQTPKYGLIFHASLVGQAPQKLKGKISRMLAAKSALSVRMDALGESDGATIGLEARMKVESRLAQLEGGSASAAARTPKTPQQQKYVKPTET